MKKHIIAITLICSLLFSTVNSYADNEEQIEVKLDTPRVIMHAGGEIYGEYLTNSKESIEKSLENGFNYVEVDFSWTTDGVPVLVHDWGTFSKWFDVAKREYSYDEFKKIESDKYTQLDIPKLIRLMKDNPELVIITDGKDENIEILSIISEKYSEYVDRFIPQIYNSTEYQDVYELGFKNIIFTLYKAPESNDEIINMVKNIDIFAITMPVSRASEEFVKGIKEYYTPVFVHTLNDRRKIKSILELVDGVYSDVGYTPYFDFNNIDLNICYTDTIKYSTITNI